MLRKSLVLAMLAPLSLGACDDATGPEDGATVAVRFATASPALSVAPAQASFALNGQQQELRIEGANGTLVITDVQLIVAEFELEGPEACVVTDDDGEEELEECEFEGQPFLLDLPLTAAGAVEVIRDEVPLGTYTEFEFEIEDLDEDEDDEQITRQGIAAIRQQIAAAIPGVTVPREASMFVQGRFIPTTGAERPFLTLFDADIEVEMSLIPPLVITQEGATRVLTVNLDPALWFTSAGRVLDLSAFDFARTGELLEFEAEIGEGFEIEIDD